VEEQNTEPKESPEEREPIEQKEIVGEQEPVEQKKIVVEKEPVEKKEGPRSSESKKRIVFWGLCLAGVVVAVWAFVRFVIPKIADIAWFSNEMIAVYIAAGFIGTTVGACFFLRKTLRTRLRMQKAIRDDPDINDWLIMFDWTPKILYVPTIVASFLAAVLSGIFSSIPPGVIGGIWLAIFILNFLVEEYNTSIKVLLIGVVGLGFFLLWLHLLGRVADFLNLFKHIAVSIDPTIYFLVGIIGLVTIFISWLKGLFYYVTITPNYMNLQEGPTESGEQIGREDYNSRVDTTDFLERLMGFGRIVITFKDRKRQPITILVWGIHKKTQRLEKVRAKFAIDHLQQP